MKKLILAVLLLSLPSWATIAFVGSGSTSKACGTTGTCGPGSIVLTAGNTMIVAVAFYNGASNTPHVTSITDTQRGTYSSLVTYQPADNVFVEIWYTASIATTNATGNVTVNYTPTGTGTSMALTLLQYSGVLAVNTNNPQTNSNASATSASLTITTNNNNNFVVGAFADHPSNAFTVSGCTARENTNNSGGTANLQVCDNTSATPAATAVGVTFASAAWAGAAIELCTVNPCVSAGGGRIRHQVITGE